MKYNAYIEAKFEICRAHLQSYVLNPSIIFRDYSKKRVKITFTDLIKTQSIIPNELYTSTSTVVLYINPFNIDETVVKHNNILFAPSLVNETHIVSEFKYNLKRENKILYIYV